jgi:hypothetical protein
MHGHKNLKFANDYALHTLHTVYLICCLVMLKSDMSLNNVQKHTDQ